MILVNPDGTGCRTIVRDSCWCNHFQFSPLDPNIALFCHEGPWNLVNQRMYLVDCMSLEITPCFRQEKDDCVGLADSKGNVLKTIPMPYYCNHYHANNDNTLLVGDQTDHLVLIDIHDEQHPAIKTLCNHGTSWTYQRTHCHPTFSWSCDQILYTSDRDGVCNIYSIGYED